MSKKSGLLKDARGAAVIEFALVAPVLLVILLGIMAYGQYFWMAHGLQQAANDGARAAIAGLTATERHTLSESAVTQNLQRAGGIDAGAAVTLTDDDGTELSVAVSYDDSRNAFMRFSMVPLPNRIISRTATIRLAGV